MFNYRPVLSLNIEHSSFNIFPGLVHRIQRNLEISSTRQRRVLRIAGCGKTLWAAGISLVCTPGTTGQTTQDAQKGRPLRPSFVKRRSSLVVDLSTEFLRDTLHDSRFTRHACGAGGLFQHPDSCLRCRLAAPGLPVHLDLTGQPHSAFRAIQRSVSSTSVLVSSAGLRVATMGKAQPGCHSGEADHSGGQTYTASRISSHM